MRKHYYVNYSRWVSKENGRGSWTRTNECQDQNLVPYQLGDTPLTVRTIPILDDFVKHKNGEIAIF